MVNPDPWISPAHGSSALELLGVRLCLGQRVILDNVSLEVRAGETVAVIGRSGSGKTSLLNAIAGYLPVQRGQIRVDGRLVLPPGGSGLREIRLHHLGMVFQQAELLEELSAVENVQLPALLGGQSPKESRQRAQSLLAAVDLSGAADQRPDTLSGGERQRTAVARALVNNPAVLLADEPTGSLDESTREDVLDAMLTAAAMSRTAIIIVTHDRDVAARARVRYELSGGALTRNASAFAGQG
jgi:ABC-type lipoprotein export system ATPase subunit